MKLAEAHRLARQLEQAEADFDSSWSRRWRAITVRGAVLLMPVGIAAGLAAQALGYEALMQPALWGTWGLSSLALAGVGPLLRRRAKRSQGMESMDARVLQACAGLEGVPSEVAEPLEQALDAYLEISRMSGDPVWEGCGFSMREQVDGAGRRLISLLDWGKRLADVSRTVARLADRPEGPGVRAQYQGQLDRFQGAAAAFLALEAKVARAFVALTGAAPNQKMAQQEVTGLGASFDALAEVLTASEAGLAPSNISPSTEEAAALRVGRG